MYQSPSPPSSPRNPSRDRVRADQSRLRGQCQVHTQVNPSRVSTSSRVSSLSRTYIMAWHHPSHSTTTPVKTANHDRGFARRILFTFVPGPVEARTEFEAGWRSVPADGPTSHRMPGPGTLLSRTNFDDSIWTLKFPRSPFG